MLKKKTLWGTIRKVIIYTFLTFIGLLIIGFIYLAAVAIEYPPKVKDESSLQLQRTETSPGFYTLNNNWFRKSNSGLYELYVEGTPFQRGVINGKLTKELVVRQEDHFNEQINKMIPSKFYL
ncbi:MAG: peptidase C45, partial [Sphingobacteriales bacterium]|nr:peptidase C45 [Sphingobacteriales bacterium]